MSSIKKDALRLKESFGIAGVLQEDSRVIYENIFNPTHIGRVSDLISAYVRDSELDELSLRTVLLLSTFQAYRVQISGSDEWQTSTLETLANPILVECGRDAEKIVIGVSYTCSEENPVVALDGLSERLVKGELKGELETLLNEISRVSDYVLFKVQPAIRRYEIVSMISLESSKSDENEASREPLEVIIFNDELEPKQSPKVEGYVELGDLDYPQMLKEEKPGGKIEPSATGQLLSDISLAFENEKIDIKSLENDLLAQALREKKELEKSLTVKGKYDELDETMTKVSGSVDESLDNEMIKVDGGEFDGDQDEELVKVKGYGEEGENQELVRVNGFGVDDEDLERVNVKGSGGDIGPEVVRVQGQKQIQEALGGIQTLKRLITEDQDSSNGGGLSVQGNTRYLEELEKLQNQLKEFEKFGKADGLSSSTKGDSGESESVFSRMGHIKESLFGEKNTDEKSKYGLLSRLFGSKEGSSEGEDSQKKREDTGNEIEQVFESKSTEKDSRKDRSALEKEQELYNREEELRKREKNLEKKIREFEAEEEAKIDESINSKEKDAVDAGNIEKKSQALIQEIGGLGRTIKKAEDGIKKLGDSESEELKKTRDWAKDLMKEVAKEKARLNNLTGELTQSIKKKEFEFSAKERELKEFTKKKDDLLKQKDTALARSKEQMAQLQINIEHLKKVSAAKSNQEDKETKLRLEQSQVKLEALKTENSKLVRKLDEASKSLASLKVDSDKGKEKEVDYAEFTANKQKLVRSERQIEELKKTNKQLMQRVTTAEAKKFSAPVETNKMDEIKNRLDQAMRVVTAKKKESETLKQKLNEANQKELKLKQDLNKAQQELKKVKMDLARKLQAENKQKKKSA